MDLGIAHKRAAVAGASSGLGYAAAAALIDAGVSVVICGRDRDRIDAAAARLGPAATPVVADVGTAEGGRRFVTEAAERLGGLDIVVPNAGGPPPGNFASTDLAAYLPALELNLLSVVGMCTEAIPLLRSEGWGRIVAITSLSVRQPIPGLILSNTARAGVTGFLKSLALEVAAEAITVNSVQPGLHDTDRLRSLYGGDPSAAAADIPTRTIGRAEDFGAVVAFLCSDAARFITGTAVPVDGGANRALF